MRWGWWDPNETIKRFVRRAENTPELENSAEGNFRATIILFVLKQNSMLSTRIENWSRHQPTNQPFIIHSRTHSLSYSVCSVLLPFNYWSVLSCTFLVYWYLNTSQLAMNCFMPQLVGSSQIPSCLPSCRTIGPCVKRQFVPSPVQYLSWQPDEKPLTLPPSMSSSYPVRRAKSLPCRQ